MQYVLPNTHLTTCLHALILTSYSSRYSQLSSSFKDANVSASTAGSFTLGYLICSLLYWRSSTSWDLNHLVVCTSSLASVNCPYSAGGTAYGKCRMY